MSDNATLAAVAALTETMAITADGLDCAWILICAALVVIMQVGFAYVEAGNVRVKNVRSILLKNTVDYVLGGLAFVFIANGIARGKSLGGFIGIDAYGAKKPEWETASDAYYSSCTLYSALFACTTSTIISGSIAERMRLSTYMLLSFISPFLLYALPAHWVWNADGFLNSSTRPYMAVSDFAGGAVVHATGGVAAFVAAWYVGPRIGRFHTKTGKDKEIEGHSAVLGGLGTWLILFGWFGFNAGSSLQISTTDGANAAAVASMNTFIAVLMGALVSILYHALIIGKHDLGEMFNNMLAGAASITAGCGFVDPVGAVVIGGIGSIVYVISGPIIAKRLKVDDPLGAISVHFSAASTGFLLIGLFHTQDGLLYGGGGMKMAAQTIGLLVIMVNAAFWTALVIVVFTLLIGPVRVEEKIELEGCDTELDGIAAYEQNSNNSMLYTTLAQNACLSLEFDEFLKSIYCYHNVAFLTSIAKYEKQLNDPAMDSAAEAQSIYDNFICPDGVDPVSLPDWQVTQIRKHIKEAGAQLNDLFGPAKQEVHSLLDTTIATHFTHTPIYQRHTKKKKNQSAAPLHFLSKAWCFRNGKSYSFGRARVKFDPRRQFKHTEDLIESDDEDIEAAYSLNTVNPLQAGDEDDDE